MKTKTANPNLDTYRREAAMTPKGPVKGAIKRTRLFMRMLWDRAYKTSWTTKLTAIGGLAYLIVPADLLPDVIPVLGLIDDAAVLGLVIAQMNQEVSRYQHFLTKGSLPRAIRVKKSPYQAAIEEVDTVAPTPARVGETLGAVAAR